MKEGRNAHYLALLLMVLTVVFWGLSIISTKVVLAQIPPVSIAFFRYSIATATLIPLALLTHSLPKITLRDLGTITVTSLLGIVLYFLFENNALQYTTASNASMLVAAMPLFAVIIGALFFRQRVSRKNAGCYDLDDLFESNPCRHCDLWFSLITGEAARDRDIGHGTYNDKYLRAK